MVFEYEFSFFDCQSCQSRVHCADCSEKAREALSGIEGVSVLEADLERRLLRVEMPPDKEDEVTDALERRRFFAE